MYYCDIKFILLVESKIILFTGERDDRKYNNISD